MQHRLLLLLIAAATLGRTQNEAAFIEQVRANALAYDEGLPNFVCTQETRRTAASNGRANAVPTTWKPVDTLTIRLTYAARKEDYLLLKVNGKPVNKSIDKVGGSKTKGDFGSMARDIFQARSQAKFQLERGIEWNGKKVAVIAYTIDRDHSNFHTSSKGFRRAQSVIWGAKGTIYADAETSQVLRVTVDATDLPPDFPVREIHLTMEYAKQKIGDRDYWLPWQSTSETVTLKERRKSESRFGDYHKFGADTAITFDQEKM